MINYGIKMWLVSMNGWMDVEILTRNKIMIIVEIVFLLKFFCYDY